MAKRCARGKGNTVGARGKPETLAKVHFAFFDLEHAAGASCQHSARKPECASKPPVTIKTRALRRTVAHGRARVPRVIAGDRTAVLSQRERAAVRSQVAAIPNEACAASLSLPSRTEANACRDTRRARLGGARAAQAAQWARAAILKLREKSTFIFLTWCTRLKLPASTGRTQVSEQVSSRGAHAARDGTECSAGGVGAVARRVGKGGVRGAQPVSRPRRMSAAARPLA